MTFKSIEENHCPTQDLHPPHAWDDGEPDTPTWLCDGTPIRPKSGTFTIATGRSTLPHLVLTAANGEPIVWSETYTSGDTGAREALEVVVRTVLTAYLIRFGVEPDMAPSVLGDLVEQVTDQLLTDDQ